MDVANIAVSIVGSSGLVGAELKGPLNIIVFINGLPITFELKNLPAKQNVNSSV